MSEQIREYLTLKNILVIILIWVILLFINPAGNGWLFLPEEYSKDWLIYFIGDSLVLITCFTFKALIDRDYRKVFFLSGIALLNLSIVYFLVFNQKINTSIVPFFHPITLSIPTIFLIEKKYKLTIIGYLSGYFFSFGPFLMSLIPILFLQIWFDSLKKPTSEKWFSRFLVRFFIYAITSTLIFLLLYSLTNDKLIFPSVSFSKTHEIIMSALAVIAIYLVLGHYLRLYYERYGNQLLRVLSYFPVLWIIPLFEIVINCKNKDNFKL